MVLVRENPVHLFIFLSLNYLKTTIVAGWTALSPSGKKDLGLSYESGRELFCAGFTCSPYGEQVQVSWFILAYQNMHDKDHQRPSQV